MRDDSEGRAKPYGASGSRIRLQASKGVAMRWLGIGLALGGVVVALVAGFAYQSIPLVIGGIVFALIGMIVFIKGYSHQPK